MKLRFAFFVPFFFIFIILKACSGLLNDETHINFIYFYMGKNGKNTFCSIYIYILYVCCD